MRIFLLGFMGAGKSSLGPVLAERGGLLFFDLDDEIARSAKRSIAEIFTVEGEEAFRRLEREELESFRCREGLVLATGGGILEREENHLAVTESHSVYLAWPWLLLRDRLQADGSGRRPLLAGDEHALYELWRRRDPVYRRLCRQVLDFAARDAREPRERHLQEIADRILSSATEDV